MNKDLVVVYYDEEGNYKQHVFAFSKEEADKYSKVLEEGDARSEILTYDKFKEKFRGIKQ